MYLRLLFYGEYLDFGQKLPASFPKARKCHNTMFFIFLCFQVVTLTIERTSTSGQYGAAISVRYTTLSPSEFYSFLPSSGDPLSNRADYTDFNQTSGFVTFGRDVRQMTLNVTLLRDDVAEIEESVFVVLTGVELVLGAEEEQYGK